jgi:L-rhamnonate dehydratase
MRISHVETIRIRAPVWPQADTWCTSPMDALFDQSAEFRDVGMYNVPRHARRDETLYVIVRVRTDEGVDGLGVIGLGSQAMANVVESQLAPLILGQNPFDVELLWTKMFRATINIGRTGLVLEAISGIDIALWDIMGKALRQPCYNLLGGRTRSRIRAYCSAGYPTHDLDVMGARAAAQMARGYTAFKMRFGHGPADGRVGMRRNRDMVATIREAIGPDADLMADAYMGWTAEYAIPMIRMLEPFELTWIEEPVPPDDIAGYARIRRSVGTAISGGEHEFTRWGFRRLIEAGAVDYLQPDVNRVGGITEARKIWALAQSFDMPVVPHAHNIHNQHLIMSHMNSPMSEHFPSDIRDGDTFLSEFLEGEAAYADGHLTLNGEPGLGVRLNEDLVNEYRL